MTCRFRAISTPSASRGIPRSDHLLAASSALAVTPVPDNRGLAQFSNRNFVTQDTNYGDFHILDDCCFYALPSINATALRTEVVNEALRDTFGGITVMPVNERIFTSFPQDSYRGMQETDPFHTFHAILDLETRTLPGMEVYSLADASYLTRASMLIPSAPRSVLSRKT